MKPIISIIIPTWNTCQITLKCLKSIKKYLPKNFSQIIIIDNNSTDDTYQVFSKLSDIIYIRNSANLGFSRANNIGAAQATADYLLFLNSDMELIDDSLTKLVNYYQSHQQTGLVGPKFLNPDLTPQGSVTPPQTPLNAFRQFWLGQHTYSKYTPNGHHPIDVANISGGAILISRDIFIKVNGWDERYFFYFEDLELCRQIHKLGKSIIYYPDCRLIHHHGASGVTITDPLNQWRRQIPGSKIYHGLFEHYLIFFITWTSQRLFRRYSATKSQY